MVVSKIVGRTTLWCPLGAAVAMLSLVPDRRASAMLTARIGGTNLSLAELRELQLLPRSFRAEGSSSGGVLALGGGSRSTLTSGEGATSNEDGDEAGEGEGGEGGSGGDEGGEGDDDDEQTETLPPKHHKKKAKLWGLVESFAIWIAVVAITCIIIIYTFIKYCAMSSSSPPHAVARSTAPPASSSHHASSHHASRSRSAPKASRSRSKSATRSKSAKASKSKGHKGHGHSK